MRYLLLLVMVFLASCDRPPDGVRVDGDEARVSTFAAIEYVRPGDVRFEVDPPRLALRKWLYENDFEYRYFMPDTSQYLLDVMGDLTDTRGRPIRWGTAVYRR